MTQWLKSGGMWCGVGASDLSTALYQLTTTTKDAANNKIAMVVPPLSLGPQPHLHHRRQLSRIFEKKKIKIQKIAVKRMRKLELLLHMYALCSIQHNKEVMILTLYWLLESFPESGRHSLHITASVYYFRTDIKK